MDNELKIAVSSHRLAEAIGLRVEGPEIEISGVVPFASVDAGVLCFSKASVAKVVSRAVVIAPDAENTLDGCLIASSSPRLDFARALLWLSAEVGFRTSSEPPKIHPTVRIGTACTIGNGVRIGAHSVIGNNVTIAASTTIGERCVVKSGAVVGEDGFGFERDESGMPVRLVHLGSVLIGNDVEIGSLTTVCRGTLRNTVIEDYVKIDDHVHIAHNVTVRRGAMVTACAEVSGGVEIGEFSWVGPNASVIQQLKIGSGSLIGIAANVLKDVPKGAVMIGNPAKQLPRDSK